MKVSIILACVFSLIQAAPYSDDSTAEGNLESPTSPLLQKRGPADLHISGNGRATYYGTSLTDAAPTRDTPGSCGPNHLPYDSKYFVAINQAQMQAFSVDGNPNNNPLCGKCLKVTCASGSCIQGQSQFVTITDTCPSSSCSWGALDLSQQAFADIVGGWQRSIDVGAMSVSWEIADCPSKWGGPVSGSSNVQLKASATIQQISAQVTCAKTHTIVSGDICWKLSADNGLTVLQLQALNPGINCDNLQIGASLCLKGGSSSSAKAVCTRKHRAVLGESCWSIASDNGMQLSQFLAYNEGIKCYGLQIGQAVCLN